MFSNQAISHNDQEMENLDRFTSEFIEDFNVQFDHLDLIENCPGLFDVPEDPDTSDDGIPVPHETFQTNQEVQAQTYITIDHTHYQLFGMVQANGDGYLLKNSLGGDDIWLRISNGKVRECHNAEEEIKKEMRPYLLFYKKKC